MSRKTIYKVSVYSLTTTLQRWEVVSLAESQEKGLVFAPGFPSGLERISRRL